jgi:hypothetical protein
MWDQIKNSEPTDVITFVWSLGVEFRVCQISLPIRKSTSWQRKKLLFFSTWAATIIYDPCYLYAKNRLFSWLGQGPLAMFHVICMQKNSFFLDLGRDHFIWPMLFVCKKTPFFLTWAGTILYDPCYLYAKKPAWARILSMIHVTCIFSWQIFLGPCY